GGHARVLPRQGADEGLDRAGPAQELPPGVAARLGLHDVRRAEARARPAHGAGDAKCRSGGNVKKILIQLDTDQHPSTFDSMVAHDAGVDALLRYGAVEPDVVQGLVQSAYFTRPPGDANLAVWVGGSRVGDGEDVLEAVKKSFFGPFHVSVMLDSNGCNTTACTTVARLAAEMDLKGRRAVIVGAGAVGLRAAKLLIDEGCDVTVSGIPKDRFEGREYRRARGLTTAEERDIRIAEPDDEDALKELLDGASLVLAAGP